MSGVKTMNPTTRSFILLCIGVAPPWALAADSKSINTAIDCLKTACVSGEHLEIKAEGDGGISFLKKGVQGKLYFSKKDARGVVDSLTDEAQRDNLQEQRECMRPYINRILDAILQDEHTSSGEPRHLLPPMACPTSSPINMVGQVASDIPGTPLQLCQAVTSIIDKRTRPIDVYYVQRQAGQSVKFRIQCNEFCSLSLWNPNTIDVRSGANVFTVRSNYNHEVFKVYTAAVAGIYPLSIRASRSGDRYIASVQPVQ